MGSGGSRALWILGGTLGGIVIAAGSVFGIVAQQSSVQQPQKYSKVISYDQ